MIIGILFVVVLALVLSFRQGSNKKALDKNPSDRAALIKLFNACDAPGTFREAATYGVIYLNHNPKDYQIMNLTAYGFHKVKSAAEIKAFLENRIGDIEAIVDNPQSLSEQIQKNEKFILYASNLFVYYGAALEAFNDFHGAKYYEDRAESLTKIRC
jgi:hypothetical protein